MSKVYVVIGHTFPDTRELLEAHPLPVGARRVHSGWVWGRLQEQRRIWTLLRFPAAAAALEWERDAGLHSTARHPTRAQAQAELTALVIAAWEALNERDRVSRAD